MTTQLESHPAPLSLLSRLRAATASLHERLDSSLDLQPDTITHERYARFLRAQLTIVPELEARIAAVPGWRERVPEATRRLRASRLADDLRALGLDPAPLSAAISWPAISSLGAAFGAGYVLEGSALGGAVLGRTLGPRLALSPDHGLAYFSAYGADLRAMWTSFVSALEDWASSAGEPERELAVATACATFHAFLGLSAPPASDSPA